MRKDPAPLKVKRVTFSGSRNVVCLNEEQRQADALSHQTIVESLRRKLEGSAKGCRRFLKRRKGGFELDEEKMKAEARFDGKWVLRTNMELDAGETALKYKRL